MANNFSIFHNSFDWTVLIILAAGMLFFSKRNFLDINLTVAKFNLDFSSVVLFEALLFSLRNKQRKFVVDNECYAVHKVYLDILVLYQSIAFQKLNLKGNCFIVNILPLFVTLKEIEILF